MVEKSLILTGGDAELLSHALAEVKTKACGGPRPVWMTQALDALVSCFRNTEESEQEKERRHTYFSLLGKRLVLGTLIGTPGGTVARADRGRGFVRLLMPCRSSCKSWAKPSLFHCKQVLVVA